MNDVKLQTPVTDTPSYEEPRIMDYGRVEDLTGESVIGTVTDQDFPAGTPVTDLTFSL